MTLSLQLILTVSALIGLLVGSFLATPGLRLPEGKPVVYARSACPRCGHPLRAGELIPVLSWLLQGRRCRSCRAPISVFYPMMEILSAVIAAAAAYWVAWPEFVAVWFVGWGLLCFAARAFLRLRANTARR